MLCVSEARVLYYLPPAYVTFKYAQTGFLISCCCLLSPLSYSTNGTRRAPPLSVFARRRTEQHIIHRRCCVVVARAFRCFFFAPQKYVVYIDRYLNSALCVCVCVGCFPVVVALSERVLVFLRFLPFYWRTVKCEKDGNTQIESRLCVYVCVYVNNVYIANHKTKKRRRNVYQQKLR